MRTVINEHRAFCQRQNVTLDIPILRVRGRESDNPIAFGFWQPGRGGHRRVTRPRPSYVPTPRILDDYQTATRLGRALSWFKENRARLEAEGFPQRDDLLGGTDGDAVDHWLDRRSGLVDDEVVDHDDTMTRLEAFANGQG